MHTSCDDKTKRFTKLIIIICARQKHEHAITENIIVTVKLCSFEVSNKYVALHCPTKESRVAKLRIVVVGLPNDERTLTKDRFKEETGNKYCRWH